MISAKRITSIFRQTGGGDDFTKLADDFSDEQIAPLREDPKNERMLIVGLTSASEWFAITKQDLVVQDRGGSRRILLESIDWIVTRDDNYKANGGTLGVKLRDGSIVSINIHSGKPYVALMNVFMYIGRVGGPPSGRGLTGSPTTDDQRPTTAS
jgi:hypothetical protein